MRTERNGRRIGAWRLQPFRIFGFTILAAYASSLGQIELPSLQRSTIAADLLTDFGLALAKIPLREFACAAAVASGTSEFE